MTKKLDLHIEDLEDRIAPALLLPGPNDMVIFGDFNLENGEQHPAFANPHTAGPWNAHINSPAIDGP